MFIDQPDQAEVLLCLPFVRIGVQRISQKLLPSALRTVTFSSEKVRSLALSDQNSTVSVTGQIASDRS